MVNVVSSKRCFYGFLVVFGIVFLASIFGILTRPLGLLASFWPANAILLGLLLRYPHFANWMSWIGAVVAFVVADLLTGSSLDKSLLLTAGNMAGIAVGYALFSRIERDTLLLTQPNSIIYFIAILIAASAVAGVVGAIATPVLFGGSASIGFYLWFVTELVNYIAILPVILTMPSLYKPSVAWEAMREEFFGRFRWSPVVILALSLIAGFEAGGGISLTYPVPALLICALCYRVFTTAVFTLVYSMWALLAVTLENIQGGIVDPVLFDLVLVRLGVVLIALAPITVASVMAARNELLKVAMAARAEAEEAMSARSLLLATMAHELKTPLNAMIGFSNVMAAETFGRIGNKKYLEYSHSIGDAGSHLLGLVNDLLDTAKVEAGAISLEFSSEPSRDLVEHSVRLVRGIAKDRGVSFDIQPSPWPQVDVDPRAIKQVLLNLLSNATKFSPEKGVIVISSRINGSRLVIQVRDFGCGIAPEAMSRIGRPYVQTGDLQKRREGTGLGLALSMNLVKEHGGELTFESELGKGTTFRFDVPLCEPVDETSNENDI